MKRVVKLSMCLLLLLSVMLIVTSNASALQISWTDWTSAQSGYPGTANGTITMLDGSTIGVNYSGEVAWAQTSGGTNWWSEGTPAPYTGNTVVDNAPPASDIIVVNQGYINNTLTFERPVEDLVMAFVSIGQPSYGVNYNFSSSFTLLSEGQGWWGNGSWAQSGNNLTGYEAHGAVQFNNSLTSLSWVNTPGEYWHGFTVGAPNQSVPEPSTMLLLGCGLLGLVGVNRRRKA